MWPCNWGLAPLCVPSPWPLLPYWKAIQSLLVEQMLYRAEHAWLVWQCKVTLSHQMLQAQLLSPLKFSIENQKANSKIPGWSVNLRLINSPCVFMCAFCFFFLQEGKRRCRKKKKTHVVLFSKTKMLHHHCDAAALKDVTAFKYRIEFDVGLHASGETCISAGDIWDFPSELSEKDPKTTKGLFSIPLLSPQFRNWASVGVQACRISGVKPRRTKSLYIVKSRNKWGY